MFFLEIVFRKNYKKDHKFFMCRKLFEILKKKNFSKKKFPKKTFFFKKKKNAFFQKNKVLVYRGKNFFSPKKISFCKKIKCPLNCPFVKIRFFSFALQIQSVCGLPPRYVKISQQRLVIGYLEKYNL